MPFVVYPIREDDRTMNTLRRRDLRIRKRERPQTPVGVATPKVDNGIKYQSIKESRRIKDFDDDRPNRPGPKHKDSTSPPRTSTSSINPSSPAVKTIPTISSTFAALGSSSVSVAPQTTSTSLPPMTPEAGNKSTSSTQGDTNQESPTSSSIISSVSPSTPTSEAVNAPAPIIQPKATLSHGATVALTVIGIGASIAIIVGIGFWLYKRWRRRQPPNSPDISQVTRSFWGRGASIWGGQSISTRDVPPIIHPEFVPPVTMEKPHDSEEIPNPHGRPDTVVLANGNNAVDRQERLGRVRASLLGQRELNGGLMRIHTPTGGGAVPGKAFLSRSAGDNVIDRGLDMRGDGVFNDKGRVDIEASGMWDDAVTIARGNARGSLASRLGPAPIPRGITRERPRSRVVEAFQRERESTASVPRWRDMGDWVKDQISRKDNHKGMSRLPG